MHFLNMYSGEQNVFWLFWGMNVGEKKIYICIDKIYIYIYVQWWIYVNSPEQYMSQNNVDGQDIFESFI